MSYSCSVARNLADVAKQVGVSEATVSRVLNDKPGVSEATRQAVLTALDVLGYERPTKLRGERARLVGLVLPELQNPIFPAFAEVVGGALAQRGFTPVLCTQTRRRVRGRLRRPAARAAGLRHRLRGRPVRPGGRAARALPAAAEAAPADRAGQRGHRGPRLPARLARTTRSPWSRRWATSLARPRRIGVDPRAAGPRAVAPQARRRRAPRPRAGGARRVAELVERTLFSLEGGQAAATRLLEAGVTGIVCASDPMALGAIRAARRAGLTVPADVSVVGFDDSAFMNCTDPPLTTVRQPIEAIGRAGWRCCSGQIAGTAVPADELLFEPELVVRGSTAARAVRLDAARLTRRSCACAAVRQRAASPL